MAKKASSKKAAATDLDVAVVGGGVSGAYSAWRLQAAHGEKQKIGFFEYSDRIGGRLFSRTLPGMPHVYAELGGMRYIPSTQPLVTGLIGTLKLPNRDFPMGNPDPKIGATLNYNYLRGRHILNNQWQDTSLIPYGLSWQERAKSPDDLQAWVLNLYVPNWQELSFSDWFEVEVFGRPLYTLGYWNFLNMVISDEAYAFMRDGQGYDANVANASAVSQLPALDYGPETSFRTLVNGYESLPATLADQFDAAGGTTYRNHRLASIRRREGGGYLLTFVPTVTKDYVTTDEPGAKPVEVKAAKVILAMPRRSLQLIEWEQWTANPFLRNNLDSVLIQAAFKLFMGYDYPWWRSLNLFAGRAITDIPVRQIYYFGTEGEQEEEGADPANQRSLLMASYNDISTVPFWKALENDEPYSGNKLKANRSIDPVPPSEYTATQSMVDIAHRQVLEVHGLRKVDAPYSAIFHDWSGDPYGGGWHEWKAGYRYDAIIRDMVKPVASEEVYIIGEAYSNNQGWVEGALETAEDMMKRYFKLPFLPKK